MGPGSPRKFRADDMPPPPGAPTSGMDRRELLDADGAWIGWVRTEPGYAGGWHHHGERESWIYQLNGEMTIEFGLAGAESLVATPGDVVVVPPGVVHREITPGSSAEVLVVRVGTGPLNVNVDGPEGSFPEA